MSSRIRKFFQAKNIFVAIQPLHKYSKFFGISVFSINSQNGEIRVTKFDIFVFTVNLLSYLYLLSYYLYDIMYVFVEVDPEIDEAGVDDSTFLTYIKLYQYLSIIVLAIFLVTFDFLNYKNVEKFIREIEKFDKKIKVFVDINSITYSRIYIVGLITFSILLFTAFELAIDFDLYQQNYLIIGGRSVVVFVCAAIQFYFSTFIIKKRIKLITKYLM